MDETPLHDLTPGPVPARHPAGSPVLTAVAWTLFLTGVSLSAAAVWFADWRFFWTALPVFVGAAVMHPGQR